MENEIKQQFDELGIEPTSDVLGKCLELCASYNVTDAEEFVEQWMSFSISHINGEEPSITNLNEFERKVFQMKREKELAFSAKHKKQPKYHTTAMANLTHLNATSTTAAAAAASSSTLDRNPLAMYGVDDDTGMEDYMSATADVGTAGGGTTTEDDVLDTYNVVHTPKAKRTTARTPARHSDALFSPASYSPIGTPRTHIAAAGSGKIVYTFGSPTLIGSAQWRSLLQQPHIRVRQLLLHNGDSLSAHKSKYMFDNLREKAEIAGDRLFYVGQRLCRKVFGGDVDDYELQQVDVHSQDTVRTIGTIFCDHDGPLDASSTLLVGSDEMRCRTVRLNFSKAKAGVGVFPGQVAIVAGRNPKGDIFMVDEVLAERELAPPQPPQVADQLSFVVAAGPYTHDDDLVYDPLQDLIAYLKDNRPDVLILTGPFLAADHKLIGDNLTLAETFESFFEKMIASIVEQVGTATTILVVASHRDANTEPVYPTMPITLKRSYANVHMLPDPSMVDLNGITIGITSTDIMSHIVRNELAVNAGDKVKRVVNYLFNQGSFYPLSPPEEDSMCFDSCLANKYANIEQIPNILILPSDQKCFIRVVNNCLTINPGRLADSTGGTFARFIIKPPAPKDEMNLFNYVGCQVRKV